MRTLVIYLDHLQMTDGYGYTTLCMHASAICNILQPTEQTRTSRAPLVKQGSVHKEATSKTLDLYLGCQKGLRPTSCLGKPLVLKLHTSNTEDSHDLGPSHSQEAIRSEPPEDHSRGYADIRGLSYLPTSVLG